MVNPTGISTSPRAVRPLVEDALRLHARDLRNGFGWIAPDLVTSDGTRIRTRIEAGAVTWLHLEHRRPGSAWADAAYAVSLISSPQPRGGERWQFICPDGCGPCAALYLPPGARHFASREAHGLAFASQRLRAPARAAARARRIREGLGGSGDLAAPLVRPKRMWASTFARRSAELAQLVEVAASVKSCSPPAPGDAPSSGFHISLRHGVARTVPTVRDTLQPPLLVAQ